MICEHLILYETLHLYNIRRVRMSSNDTKHVQTELNGEEYERFREFAEEHELFLKEASHEALIEWVERQQQANPNDAAFTILDDLDDSSLPRTAQTDAREEDDLVDEWHGNDESFVLAEDPSSDS
jgi:hypothetical protein